VIEYLWRSLIAWLVWLSADPAGVDLEAPKAAAAVAAARSSLAVDAAPPAPPPAPGPKPTPTGCRCGCTNGKIKPDGRIEIPCECSTSCTCKASRCGGANCPR